MIVKVGYSGGMEGDLWEQLVVNSNDFTTKFC
jgi:hypothetical protein